jgi:TonB-linked SusC/RagA family outer membrane protein
MKRITELCGEAKFPWFKKLFRIMKLTTFLILISMVNVFATETYSQSKMLNLKMENSTIKDVLSEIENESEFRIMYSGKLIDAHREVSVNLQNTKIDDVLTTIFAGTDVGYIIKDKFIVLTTPESNFEFTSQQQKSISGKVTDSYGESLSGVSIVVKGTNIGTTSDTNGNYSIPNIPENATLQFSFVGMKTQAIEVGSKSSINVTMVADAIGMEEVVVIGYGSVKKPDLTGSVAKIVMDKISDRPVRSVEEYMQGNIPGVTVVNNGGSPISEPIIRIRGIGTLSNEAPLWVVDGSIASGPVNPSDIETITILKDASAAAIYGARAAAGVVMVTTKKGQKGKPVINVNSYYGFQNAYNLPQPLNSAQMADAYNLAADNAGLPRQAVYNESLNPDARITRTNWMDEIFRTGAIQRHDVSISGASDNLSYLVSGGYFKNDGVLKNTYSKEYNFRINTEAKVSDKITFGENISFGSGSGQSTSTKNAYYGTIWTALSYPPSAKVYYDKENGIFGGVTDPGSPWTGSYGDLVNPVAQLLNLDNKSDNLQIGGNMFLEYEIIKNLKFKSNFGLDYSMYTDKQFQVRRLEPGKVFDDNRLDYNNDNYLSWVAEQTLSYKTVLNDIHDISVVVGYTAQESMGKGFSAAARNFKNEDLLYRYFANASIFDIYPTDYRWENSLVSYLGRLAYGYKGKYLLTANIRADGTSKLTSKNRWGIYPAVSGAWRISKESFMEGFSLINDLKLRASWGQIGNLGALENYATNVNLSKVTAFIGVPADFYTGYAMDGISNPDLKWETTTQIDIGLDCSMLNNQIEVTVDYFNKQTDDMLMKMAISGLAGVGNAPWGNVGSVRNRGIEFGINYRQTKGNFTYSFGANMANISNEVLSLGDEDFIMDPDNVRGVLAPIRTQVGSPLYSYYVYKTDGIFQTDAEIQAYKNSSGVLLQPLAKPGDMKFLNLNGDDVLNDNDKYIAGDAWPDFTLGLNGSCEYKNFDLAVFFQGALGVELFNGFKLTAYQPTQGYNLVVEALDAWSPSNTGSKIPILSLTDQNKNFGTVSDWYVEDASYLRLKNLTLGYTLPKEKLAKFGLGNLRIYLSSQNLLTFTKYSGIDPEVGGDGIDIGLYPQPRTFMFGINIGL